jgi:hypothetical protein
MKSRRLHRTRFARRVHRLVWPLCLTAGTVAIAPARAGGCVDLRGGDLLLNASQHCVTQLRRDPTVREQVTQRIGGEVGRVSVAQAAPSPPTAARSTERGRSHGLDHPLARISMLNSQSRYLWSLGNPSPTYYGQTQIQAR